MIINKYKFTLDSEGFIVGFMAVLDGDYDYEGQMSQYPNATKGYTKFVDGEFVEDAEKKKAIEDEETKQSRIAELKQLLQDTDYIHNVIAEGDATEEDYAEVLANRKAWRAEVRELEG